MKRTVNSNLQNNFPGLPGMMWNVLFFCCFLLMGNTKAFCGYFPDGSTCGHAVNVTGLDMGPAYYCWLRPNCGDETAGEWSAALPFHAVEVAAIPWVVDFSAEVTGWQIDKWKT